MGSHPFRKSPLSLCPFLRHNDIICRTWRPGGLLPSTLFFLCQWIWRWVCHVCVFAVRWRGLARILFDFAAAPAFAFCDSHSRQSDRQQKPCVCMHTSPPVRRIHTSSAKGGKREYTERARETQRQRLFRSQGDESACARGQNRNVYLMFTTGADAQIFELPPKSQDGSAGCGWRVVGWGDKGPDGRADEGDVRFGRRKFA